MIPPTVGRVLCYFNDPNEEVFTHKGQPLLCLLAGVRSPDRINVAVFDSNGKYVGGRQNVPLIQDDQPKPDGPHCTWMPFQKGQAQKTDDLTPRVAALEKAIAEMMPKPAPAKTPAAKPAAPAQPAAAAQPPSTPNNK